jgi:hypothetical protein
MILLLLLNIRRATAWLTRMVSGGSTPKGNYDTIFCRKSRVTEVVEIEADHYIKENFGIIFADATNGSITVYAPDLLPNRQYSVSKRDSSGNTVTIDFGSSTCNGSSTQIISSQYDTVTFAGVNTEWGII